MRDHLCRAARMLKLVRLRFCKRRIQLLELFIIQEFFQYMPVPGGPMRRVYARGCQLL